MVTAALNPEHLAYWYFRLNGFLSTLNFVVHPEEGSEQRTDVDLLGVRFPYRSELLTNPMQDDATFTMETERPYVVLVEVKKDRCRLNGPWTRSEDRNLHRMLIAIGVLPLDELDAAADALYKHGIYVSQRVRLSLCCVGATENQELIRKFPSVPQILWPQITDFIFQRFRLYYDQKLSHPQWDENGKLLWKLSISNSSSADFLRAIDRCMNATS